VLAGALAVHVVVLALVVMTPPVAVAQLALKFCVDCTV
jgi:hypothetical protein